MNSSSNISTFHFFQSGKLLTTLLVRPLKGKDKEREENGFVLEARRGPTKLQKSNMSPSTPWKVLEQDSQGPTFGTNSWDKLLGRDVEMNSGDNL